MLPEFVTTYLADNGAGTIGTDLFTGSQPVHNFAANCTTVYGESSFTPAVANSCLVNTEGIHILIRNQSYLAASAKAQEIHGLLADFAGVLAPDAPFVAMTTITTQPTPIGKDDKDYHEFSIHYAMRYTAPEGRFRAVNPTLYYEPVTS